MTTDTKPQIEDRLEKIEFELKHKVASRNDIADLRKEIEDFRYETGKLFDAMMKKTEQEFEGLRKLLLSRLPPDGRG